MALELKQDVEQLADALTASADQSHARLLVAINKGDITLDDARAAFQQEVQLRQHACALYIDAAISIVTGLTLTQDEFMQIIDQANKRIAKIKQIAAFIDLLADILTLAAAACAAKPKPMLTALKEVKKDLDELDTKRAENKKSTKKGG